MTLSGCSDEVPTLRYTRPGHLVAVSTKFLCCVLQGQYSYEVPTLQDTWWMFLQSSYATFYKTRTVGGCSYEVPMVHSQLGGTVSRKHFATGKTYAKQIKNVWLQIRI